jgi:hypothetical protein
MISINFSSMKTKFCTLCQMEATILYRVQVTKGKDWIFICANCCNKVKIEPNLDTAARGKEIDIKINRI